MPEVSVIVTAYKRPQYMAVLMEGLFKQTLTDWECIIVDDGSDMQELTDICRAYERQDGRVRYIQQDNGGISSARNRGIAEASAEFVAVHDDDDISHPRRLEKQVAFLRAHPQVAVVTCYGRTFTDKTGALISDEVDSAEPFITESKPSRLFPPDISYMIAPNTCFRRECLLAVGGYSADYVTGEDVELTLRMMEKFSLGTIPEYLYFMRVHDGGHLGRDVRIWRYYAAAYVSAYHRRNGNAQATEGNPLSLISDVQVLPEDVMNAIFRRARAAAKQFLRSKNYGGLDAMLGDFNKAFSFSGKQRGKMYRNLLAWSLYYGRLGALPCIIGRYK